MKLTEEWIVNNIIDHRYYETLKNLYPKEDIKKLILLNIDLRLLYLKYIYLIENNLKNILINSIFLDQVRSAKNNHFLDQKYWEKIKETKKIIRNGYIKYSHDDILKSRTINGLIEVMSFESTMSLLSNLNEETLTEIAKHFGINNFNNHEILIEQLNYVKNVRNYLAHNFKVLGIVFNQKRKNINYYQQDLEAYNDHHYLHLILDKFAQASEILPDFIDEYQLLFNNYQIEVNKNLLGK